MNNGLVVKCSLILILFVVSCSSYQKEMAKLFEANAQAFAKLVFDDLNNCLGNDKKVVLLKVHTEGQFRPEIVFSGVSPSLEKKNQKSFNSCIELLNNNKDKYRDRLKKYSQVSILINERTKLCPLRIKYLGEPEIKYEYLNDECFSRRTEGKSSF